MMLYLNLDTRHRKQSIAVIITLAGISALWAAIQLVGPDRGPFYLYNITNDGAAVGLFANRNHQSVLLAATIVMLGWYGASQTAPAKLAGLKLYNLRYHSAHFHYGIASWLNPYGASVGHRNVINLFRPIHSSNSAAYQCFFDQ